MIDGLTKITKEIVELCQKDAPGMRCRYCNASLEECLKNLLDEVVDSESEVENG